MTESATLSPQAVGLAEPSQAQLRANISRMIWPVTVDSVLQMTVSFLNTAMVGRLGAAVILAVGTSGRISMIAWALFSAIGTGATVLVARAVGADDPVRVRRVIQQMLLATLLLIAAVVSLAYFYAPQMLSLFNVPPDVLAVGAAYLRILVWSMPFQALYLVISAALRGSGNTLTPMLIGIVINAINAVLNWVLIFGNLGAPALGFRGSALATIVAQFVGAAIALWFLYSPRARLQLSIRDRIVADFPLMWKIFSIGLPSTAESFFWQAGTIILMRLINSFGTIAGAAHQLGIQAEGLSYMPAAGFGIAAMAFVGQSLGARNVKLAERYVREITKWVIILTVFTASLLFFFPKAVMRILTTDRSVIDLGARYLVLMALAQLPQQISGVLNGTLRGAGDTRTPMLIAGSGIWLIRLPLAWLLASHIRIGGLTLGFDIGILGVWWAMTIDLFIRFGLSFWRYSQGKWKTIEL